MKPLSGFAKLSLDYIVSWANHYKPRCPLGYYSTVRQIGYETNYSRNVILRALRELQGYGFIFVTYYGKGLKTSPHTFVTLIGDALTKRLTEIGYETHISIDPSPISRHSAGGWTRARIECIKNADGKCERCGIVPNILQVHHNIPARCFKDERTAHFHTNLSALCPQCHSLAHYQIRRELFGTA